MKRNYITIRKNMAVLNLMFLLVTTICGVAFAQSGELLWQSQINGTANDDDYASAIAVQGRRVFVAGSVRNEDTSQDFIVMAYDARTGELLWQDQVNGTANDDDVARGIAVQGRRIFVVGMVDDNLIVRAYDAKRGDLLWHSEENRYSDVWSNSIAVQGSRVFVAGHAYNEGTSGDFAVWAYNAETGELLWQDQVNGTANMSDGANAIEVQGNRVFVAGTIAYLTGCPGCWDASFTVRAYNANTGVLLWQDQDLEGGLNWASAIALQNRRVFAAGCLDEQLAARAYNAKTGELLWHSGENGWAEAIAIQGNRVFAAGASRLEWSNVFTVIAYDAKTGELLWQDQVNGTASYGAAESIAAQGRLVFAAGSVRYEDSSQGGDFTVRAYNAKTGGLLWQDQVNGTANADDNASAIAIQGNRVFVTGRVCNEDTGCDIPVRAYMAK